MSEQRVRFGIKTTPMHVSYEDIRRVWQEADAQPETEDAWLWDHLLPLRGPKSGRTYESWTPLGPLAAQTERLRFGLLVTSNRMRPPAVLGKIATTVDVISGGRLVMGIGVGGTYQPSGAGRIAGENPAIAEYEAYGLTPVRPPRVSTGSGRPSRSSGACGRRTSSTSRGTTTGSGARGTSPSRSSDPVPRC